VVLSRENGAVTTDHTLTAIDGALRDYETSGDAMRWTAKRVICDSGQPLMPVPWNGLRHGTYYVKVLQVDCYAVTVDVTIGDVEMTMTMTPAPDGTVPWPPPQAALDGTHKAMVTYLAGIVPAGARQHRRRCRTCNSWGNPPPSAGKYAPGPKAARMRGRRR
jgi:hypothetical protein